MCVVINLFGAPGSGKSTTMARLFADLKQEGYNVEMVSEFAEDLVYENRIDATKDELYIFAKQNHRLFKVKDKVDIVITDRPLLLTCVYDKLYGENDKNLHELVRTTFDKYNNVNILLIPEGAKYQTDGRLQDEKEVNEIFKIIYDELHDSKCVKNLKTVNTIDYNSLKEYILMKVEK